MDSEEKLLKLYELAQSEERFYLEEQSKRLGFYSGLLSAILGATILQALHAEDPSQIGLLAVGPAVSIAISILGIRSASRYYRRFIEVVTKVAKLEQKLGLTAEGFVESDGNETYWRGEALIPVTQLTSRQSTASASDFIDRFRKTGDFANTRLFFATVIVISALVAVAMLGIGFEVL